MVSSETASVTAATVVGDSVGDVGDGVVGDGVGDVGDGVVGDDVGSVGDGVVGDGVGGVGVTSVIGGGVLEGGVGGGTYGAHRPLRGKDDAGVAARRGESK